jgi:inhibitor of KinA
MAPTPKIFPLGDSALIVDFGNEISRDVNDLAIALADQLSSNPFPGFLEAAPAYSSVAVFYDLAKTRKWAAPDKSCFDTLRDGIRKQIDELITGPSVVADAIEIPVDFSDAAALDMDEVIEHGGHSRERVIEIFTARTYRVFMLGFLPGFAYMGEVDERIAIPRRSSPRLNVPRGSVGIAGRQTGVYPLESPGGWQIIGRTDVEMFRRDERSPCFLKPGDEVRFVRV